MKFLLVLAVVLIGFFVWRSNREQRRPPAARPGPDPAKAIDMLPCAVCGVHCPQADAVQGKKGVYCSVQHRRQAED